MLTRFEVQNFRGFEHLAVESVGARQPDRRQEQRRQDRAAGGHLPAPGLAQSAVAPARQLAAGSRVAGDASGRGMGMAVPRSPHPVPHRTAQQDDSGGQSQTLSIALNWAEQTVEPPAGTLREQSGSYLTTNAASLLRSGYATSVQTVFRHESRAVITENGEIQCLPCDKRSRLRSLRFTSAQPVAHYSLKLSNSAKSSVQGAGRPSSLRSAFWSRV